MNQAQYRVNNGIRLINFPRFYDKFVFKKIRLIISYMLLCIIIIVHSVFII